VQVANVSGGAASAISLRQCSEWCHERFGAHDVATAVLSRPFDLPWVVLDSRVAAAEWSWAPVTPREAVFEEIATHAERHPEWLNTSA
jgi:CDP-paratose 2-epimerase